MRVIALHGGARVKLESVLAAKGPGVITTRAATPIAEAIALLSRHNIGALVVVDAAGRLSGILSERDVIRHMAASGRPGEATVGDWMTQPVTVATPADDVDSVLRTMTVRRFRHAPVVDGSRLVGIVSIGDLVKAERDDYMGAIETLETQLMDA
jgi:CBS domain-containing protein